MVTTTKRGPIGLDDYLLSVLDGPGPRLHVPGFIFTGAEKSRGPADVSGAMANLARERRFTQQVSTTNVRPAQRLTPVQYADLYHNVRVSYFDPSGMARSMKVDVHIYNNYGITKRRANMEEKSALVGSVRRDLRRADGLRLIHVEPRHKIQIANCFYGKAGPEDFRVALMHALRYNRTKPYHLQQYCDQIAKLGVDCSGFVNTYFKRIGKISEHRHISVYEQGTLRSAQSEIRDLDVLVWQGTSMRHIAVIDHVITGSRPMKMIVVESSGSKGGLTTSEYTVLGVRNQVFEVNRGGASRRSSRVKIAAV